MKTAHSPAELAKSIAVVFAGIAFFVVLIHQITVHLG